MSWQRELPNEQPRGKLPISSNTFKERFTEWSANQEAGMLGSDGIFCQNLVTLTKSAVLLGAEGSSSFCFLLISIRFPVTQGDTGTVPEFKINAVRQQVTETSSVDHFYLFIFIFSPLQQAPAREGGAQSPRSSTKFGHQAVALTCIFRVCLGFFFCSYFVVVVKNRTPYVGILLKRIRFSLL